MSENDKREKHNDWITWAKFVLLVGTIALLAAILFFKNPGFAPKLDSRIRHYGVALNNGLMVYGHPESVGGGVVTLTDVYFVVRQADPKTKEVRNTLVSRRKSQWHSPDRMLLNANNILMMEPVDPASSVAKLIAEQEAKGE